MSIHGYRYQQWIASVQSFQSVAYSNLFQEVVEQEIRVSRTGRRLRMELHTIERFIAVVNPFIGSVVRIHKPFLPVRRQRRRIDGIAMILGRNVTTRRTGSNTGLVLSAVPESQFESVRAGS